jgi:hypothetical protein
MIELREILANFSSIGLDEMDSVKFMTRIDTKYLFTVSKISDLLESLTEDYKVLEINKKRQFKYVTTYFDTPGYSLYNQHVTGKLGRYKVRERTYEANNLSFLEVKNKTNKGRTVKSRIKKKDNVDFNSERGLAFLKEKVNVDIENLQAVLTNNFSRVTLINLTTSERVTIDFDLSFSGSDGAIVKLPFLAIAEIKRDKSSGLSPIGQKFKNMRIRQEGFSKYCVGLALLYDVPKKNTIKSKILMINKIKDEFSKPVAV